MTPRLALLLRLAAIAAVGVLLWLFARELEWGKLAHDLGHAKLWPLLVAAVLNFGCLAGKAASWRILLAPRYTVSTRRLLRYTIVAFATSIIAPARAGEVVRLWALKRRDQVPIADSAAVAVGEKLLDGVTMLMLVAPIPWLLPDLPAWVGQAIVLCSAIAIAAFGELYIAHGWVVIHEKSGWLARFIAGMHVVRSPRRLAAALATLIVVWLCDLAMVTLVLYAVGIDLPIAAGLLILFTTNLTIMLPSTPAQVGALEIGALAATRLLGVPDEPAFAFALLYHALQVLPTLAAGLALELPVVLGREKMVEA